MTDDARIRPSNDGEKASRTEASGAFGFAPSAAARVLVSAFLVRFAQRPPSSSFGWRGRDDRNSVGGLRKSCEPVLSTSMRVVEAFKSG